MIFSGEKVSVRTWQKGDESYIALQANNYNIWKNVKDSFPHPYTYDDALVWIDSQIHIEKPVNFALVIDDEPIGCIGLIQGSDIHKHNMELGYWLGEEYWGQGIVSEAISGFIPYTFNNFQINRLWSSVFSNNIASQKVLLKNGFELEATLKNAIFKNNEYHNELIFSMVK